MKTAVLRKMPKSKKKDKIEVVLAKGCIPINKPPPVLVPNQEEAISKKQSEDGCGSDLCSNSHGRRSVDGSREVPFGAFR